VNASALSCLEKLYFVGAAFFSVVMIGVIGSTEISLLEAIGVVWFELGVVLFGYYLVIGSKP
jgi:hypothetical protein